MRFRSIIWVLVVFLVTSIKVNAQETKDSTVVKEIIVFSTRGINPSGARYHIDGCRYLKNGQIKVDERKALERGLLPCSICLPERPKDLPYLRTKKDNEPKKVYRKCVFKTKSGSKCDRPAQKDGRYCELHETRGKIKRK